MPEYQAKRQCGKRARKEMKSPHTFGRKGQARVVEDLRKKFPDKEICRTDVFVETHTRKDGFATCEQLDKIKKTVMDDTSSAYNDLENDTVAQALSWVLTPPLGKKKKKKKRRIPRSVGILYSKVYQLGNLGEVSNEEDKNKEGKSKERLGDLLIEEAPLLYGVRDSLEWIRKELKSMQSFLKDAESKQTEDVRVKNWVAQIRDVCYDAEDVIDTFIFSQRAKKMDGFAGRVKRSMFLSEIRTRHKLGQQIQKIKRNISDIKMKREIYGIRDISEGRQEASSSSRSLQERRRFLVLREEPEVVGQREIINTVKEQLMSDGSRRCVISIIGMGGLGKTTLAKKVYHDVKYAFDCHAFVYLSEQFGIKDVLMRILKCVMGLSREEGEKLNEDELRIKLRDHLREKRYLVVIDDIWSTQAWDTLKLVLPIGMNKSRVMLTTRIKDIALHADPSSLPHEMRLLNDDEGWELFKKKIFPGGDPSAACPAELGVTGRKILAKCGGLRLPPTTSNFGLQWPLIKKRQDVQCMVQSS